MNEGWKFIKDTCTTEILAPRHPKERTNSVACASAPTPGPN